jgi:serine/threonine protein kinase
VHYAAEMVLAIEFCHTQKVVHRDMKPENVLIGDDKHLRLIDFGDSKHFDEAGEKTVAE